MCPLILVINYSEIQLLNCYLFQTEQDTTNRGTKSHRHTSCSSSWQQLQKDNVKLMICKKKLVCFSFLNQLRDKTRGNPCDAKEKKQINLTIKKTKELIRKCCQYHYLHVNYFHIWKHFNIAAPCSCKTLATLEPWNQKFWQKKCSAAQLN